MRLLKLLYIADREAIAETLHPITGDNAVAMDHGPVLSQTYKLIRREAQVHQEVWDGFIAQEGARNHVLINDPGKDLLSEFEIAKLETVSNMRRGMSDSAIREETHRFPEWINNEPPEGSKEDISLHDVLVAIGLAQYEERLRLEEQEEIAFETALAEVRAG
jgi:uncharacterized phage-associated protein